MFLLTKPKMIGLIKKLSVLILPELDENEHVFSIRKMITLWMILCIFGGSMK